MVVMGVDAGIMTLKAVVLRDREAVANVVMPAGYSSTQVAVERCIGDALARAGLKLHDVDGIAVTGRGREQIKISCSKPPLFLCLAKGVSRLLPSTRTVLDVGAETCLAVKCQNGNVLNTAANDKCASGTGRYLEMVSEIMDVPLPSMGEFSLRSRQDVEVLSTCAVFAESEIISLIHQRLPAEDVLRGVFRGLVRRTHSVLLRVGFERDLAMTGGVARNIGVVRALEDVVGSPVLVPPWPESVSALGAALLVAEEQGESL